MNCPWCGEETGKAQHYDPITKTLKDIRLKEGDRAACTICANIVVVEGGKYRKMTLEEELKLSDPEREILSWSQWIVTQTRRKVDGLKADKGN